MQSGVPNSTHLSTLVDSWTNQPKKSVPRLNIYCKPFGFYVLCNINRSSLEVIFSCVYKVKESTLLNLKIEKKINDFLMELDC